MGFRSTSVHDLLSLSVVGLLLVIVNLDPVESQTYFTSVQKLEFLLHNETQTIQTMKYTVKEMREYLDKLKMTLSELRKDHDKAKDSMPEGNPITIFQSIKRMMLDVRQMITDIEEKTEVERTSISEVSVEDLKGIVMGIQRIVHVYNYSLYDILLHGKVGDFVTNTGLRGDEIAMFYLTYLFGGPNPYSENASMVVSKFDIATFERVLETSLSLNLSNDVLYEEDQMVDYFMKLMTIPFLPNDTTKADHFVSLLKVRYPQLKKNIQEHRKHIQKIIEDGAILVKEAPSKTDHICDVSDIYPLACQGNLPVPEAIKSQLKCYYESYKNPYLKIGPFKIEEVYLDPRVLRIHDAIADSEIESLIEISKNKIRRGQVVIKGENVYSTARLSNGCFMDGSHYRDYPFLKKVDTRVQDMTNLVHKYGTRDTETLQTSNYGLGGYYDVHSDCTDKSETGVWRTATFMFYLTDVELGGATIFPSLNLTVFPEKGSAIFWYNVHANTQLDYRTFHSGCPVALGSKWVANQWIREPPQIFARPCIYGEVLTDDDDFYTGHWDKRWLKEQKYFTPNVSSKYI